MEVIEILFPFFLLLPSHARKVLGNYLEKNREWKEREREREKNQFSVSIVGVTTIGFYEKFQQEQIRYSDKLIILYIM